MTDQDKIQRGIDARWLMEQKLFTEAFGRLEADTIDNLVNTPANELTAIAALAERLRVIRDLQRYLVNVSMIGKETERRLQQQG